MRAEIRPPRPLERRAGVVTATADDVIAFHADPIVRVVVGEERVRLELTEAVTIFLPVETARELGHDLWRAADMVPLVARAEP